VKLLTRQFVVALGTLCCATRLPAQSVYNEAEPNALKTEATQVTALRSGDVLVGTSTGSAQTAGSLALTSADTFKLTLAPQPTGLYRHALVASSTTPGHSLRLLGLTQQSGVIVGAEVAFQSSTPATGTDRLAWYGFGRGESLHARVTGTGSTTASYALTLTSTPVQPLVVPGALLEGLVTISTANLGHSTDTEITVYDAQWNLVSGAHNDDAVAGGFTVPQAELVRTLTPGLYHVAIGVFNTATASSDANPDEVSQNSPVLEFPECIAAANPFAGHVLDVSFSDGVQTRVIQHTTTQAFEVLWLDLLVAPNQSTAFCFGDGSGASCPCGNLGGPGRGCATSFSGLGARLRVSGQASVANDSLLLAGDELSNSVVVVFQGTTQLNGGAGVAFGDGLRCAGGSVLRIGYVTTSAGTMSYPGPGQQPVSVRGAIPAAGGSRGYQIWYRNVANYCTAAPYNLSNGLWIVWTP